MNYINKIHIQYFRSIYNISFNDISDTMTIFTGKNDVGKSNVLRALNLFFNGYTNKDESISFERDFSIIRKREVKERLKTRQLIKIDIQFRKPNGYKTLPDTFWVSRFFDRNNEGTDFIYEKSIDDKKKTAAVSRFLNSIQFTYIPAIKDNDTFSKLLQSLKSNLPPLKKELIDKFNEELQGYGEDLKSDFNKKLNLTPILSLPKTTKELFSSLDFFIEDNILTPLDQRGDGIRCRFIASILNYVAKNSPTQRHIWAIEEPENSLEFFKAIELANTLENEYSKNAQIFITSHSPAFIGSFDETNRKIVYYLEKEKEKDKNDIVKATNTTHNPMFLSEKLGYLRLQNNLAECLKQYINEENKEKEKYKSLLNEIHKNINIVFVEGKTDEKYFKKAMDLYNITGFNIVWIGTEDKNGNATFCGETSLQRAYEMLSANPFISSDKNIIIFFDFDSKQKDKDSNKIHVRSSTKNKSEIIFDKGIENLLILPPSFNREPFYDIHTNNKSYGETIVKRDFNKENLCNHICSLPELEASKILKNLETELLKFDEIFKNNI